MSNTSSINDTDGINKNKLNYVSFVTDRSTSKINILTYHAAMHLNVSAESEEPTRPANLCLRNQRVKFSTLDLGFNNSPVFIFCTKFKRQVPEAQDIISCTSLAAARSGRQFPSSIAGLRVGCVYVWTQPCI